MEEARNDVDESSLFASDCLESHGKLSSKIDNLMTSNEEFYNLRKIAIGHMSDNHSLKQEKFILTAELNSVQSKLDKLKESTATMVKENNLMNEKLKNENKSLKKEYEGLEEVNQRNVDVLARTRDELDEVTMQRDKTLKKLNETQDIIKASACMFCFEPHSVSNYYNRCGHAVLCETCAENEDEKFQVQYMDVGYLKITDNEIQLKLQMDALNSAVAMSNRQVYSTKYDIFGLPEINL